MICIMENVKKYSSFIKRLVTTKPLMRKKLLKTSNLNIIKAICEIILNIYHKRIPISASALRSLKKNKSVLLRLISHQRGGLVAKKDLLVKHSDSIVAIKDIFKKNNE